MKIMINGQMFHQSNIFAVVLTTQLFSVVQIRFSNVYFYNYEHLRRFL